jgi:WD40 repeat protein
MVSLGGDPDYNLTVWDWVNERVILKCKAFGQEVFRCSFSPFTEDIIFTGGSGHIKFWKMAQTFTGLKLQGEIAKYGQLELSDVAGFHELPDGKIVSGTEYGTLILWEGNLVKAHLVLSREEKTPLHNGGIETVLFEDEHFITSGVDGWIKWWSIVDIDAAEADEIAEVTIKPTKEISIKHENGEPAHLVSMVRGKEFWLLNDAKGCLWRLSCNDFTATKVLEYHSGKITDMALSDAYNLAVTVAEDGHVKIWDYCRKKPIYSKQFAGSALSVDILRRSELNKGRVCAVGYDSGLVRIL